MSYKSTTSPDVIWNVTRQVCALAAIIAVTPAVMVVGESGIGACGRPLRHAARATSPVLCTRGGTRLQPPREVAARVGTDYTPPVHWGLDLQLDEKNAAEFA